MSTNARISFERSDGTVRSIYCHNDGYPNYVGRILSEHYDKSNLNVLMDLGDLSVLGPFPASYPEGWKTFDYDDDYCLAYKDRGETDVEAKEYSNLKDFEEHTSWCEYNYLYSGGRWYVWEYDNINHKQPLFF